MAISDPAPGIGRRTVAAVIVGLIALASGCGGGPSPTKVQDSLAALDSGLVAVEKGHWSAAEDELSSALSGPGLQPDRYEEALLARTRARLELGNLDGAAADLAVLAQGAAAMDQMLSLKAQLQLKQGDAVAAKQTFQEAKKLNARLAVPAGL